MTPADEFLDAVLVLPLMKDSIEAAIYASPRGLAADSYLRQIYPQILAVAFQVERRREAAAVEAMLESEVWPPEARQRARAAYLTARRGE